MPTIDFIAGEEHEVTAVLAYRLWEKRGRPLGSPEVDWFEAKNQLATALAKNEALIALFWGRNGPKGRAMAAWAGSSHPQPWPDSSGKE